MTLRRPAVLIFVLALVLAAASPASARTLTVVQSNVGNINVLACNDQVYKLCLRPVEQRAAKALRALHPDIVGFEEILPPKICAAAPSPNPQNLCSGPLTPASQVERLLGPGYQSRCDGRFGWDCVAVRRRTGKLYGLRTRPVLSQCTDRGFTLNAATVRLRGWPVTVTSAHPDSTQTDCRAAQIADFFTHALPSAGAAIVLGDFNMDPHRETDSSVDAWKRFVPHPFAYASSSALSSFPCGASQIEVTGLVLDPPVVQPCVVQPCVGPLRSRNIDHAVVRGGVRGSCNVQRVDGGGGMDHRAQVCRLVIPDRVTPRVKLLRRGCRLEARLAARPDGLVGVRFTAGGTRRLDTSAPFRTSLRDARGARVTPVLKAGDGPTLTFRGGCG